MKPPRIALPLLLCTLALGVTSARAADADPEPEAKPRDLGPPLVDNVKELKQLGKYAAWLDPKNRQVVVVGETVKAGYGLEFFVTAKDRGYESVLVIDARRHSADELSYFACIEAGLIGFGAKPGHPSYWDEKANKMVVATGDEVAIDVLWKDKQGKTQRTDARNWIIDGTTKKSPKKNWVFGGSRFVKNENTGKQVFLADSGDFICVANNPAGILELPIVSSRGIEDRIFSANPDLVPPAETPVTIILKPVVKAKPDAGKGEKK